MVTGEHLDLVTSVKLLTRASAFVSDLVISSASASTMSLTLPTTLVAGDYSIEATTANGVARADVSILKGETGPQGETGPKGDPGPTGPTVDVSAYLLKTGGTATNLSVSNLTLSGTLGFASPRSETVFLTAASFVAGGASAGTRWALDPELGNAFRDSTSNSTRLVGHFNLPDGSLPQSVTCYVYDNSTVDNLNAELRYWAIGGTSGLYCGSSTSSQSASETALTVANTCTTTSVGGASRITYGVVMSVANVGVIDAANLWFRGCSVTYTRTTL